jgi:hypothetical protein
LALQRQTGSTANCFEVLKIAKCAASSRLLKIWNERSPGTIETLGTTLFRKYLEWSEAIERLNALVSLTSAVYMAAPADGDQQSRAAVV